MSTEKMKAIKGLMAQRSRNRLAGVYPVDRPPHRLPPSLSALLGSPQAGSYLSSADPWL